MPPKKDEGATTLKHLKASRNNIIARLKGSVDYFNKLDRSSTLSNAIITQLEFRFQEIKPLYKSFNEIQPQIDALDTQRGLEENNQLSEQFTEQYFDLIANIKEILDEHNTNTITTNTPNIPSGNNDSIKLPPVKLPMFSGDYKWQGFSELFDSLIHKNDTLSEIQKFLYLKTHLEGSALQTIESLPPSSNSYLVARQLLIDRYDNKQYIVNSHLKALFDQPFVKKDAVSDLRKLINDVKQHLRALETLGLPVQSWDTIVIHLIKQKLDHSIKRDWEMSNNSTKELQTLQQLYAFLEKRCFAMESIYNEQQQGVKKPISRSFHTKTESKHEFCKVCNQDHPLFKCEKFLEQSHNEKVNTIKMLGVCFNCLKHGHNSKECTSRGCKKCDKRHNTLLHKKAITVHTTSKVTSHMISEEKEDQTSEVSEGLHQRSSVTLKTEIEDPQVLLATALVKIQDSLGNWYECRCLLDSGSQSNFVSAALVKKLNLVTTPSYKRISGISETKTIASKMVKTWVNSRFNTFKKELNFLVLPNITSNQPDNYINHSKWNIPKVSLADPMFYAPSSIDLLLGAELFLDILQLDQIKLGDGIPILQNTVLGWILSGKVTNDHSQTTTCLVNFTELENQISKFWEVEELNSSEKRYTIDEEKCEENFVKTTTRDSEGRFITTLPIKENISQLGDSKETAIKRFKHLERRLEANSTLKQEYSKFIEEYEKLQHMKLVTDSELEDKTVYYMPHHAVIKETSKTTKLRVVFDASCKSSTGLSLNDLLLVGPTIQEELFAILLRFRTHKYVMIADIVNMYRQIRIAEKHTNLQLILWRNSPNEELKTYKLTTVTYGTASAPFTAIRCLQELAYQEDIHPKISSIIRKDFYVDDLLTGANTIEELVTIRDNLMVL